MDGGEPAHVAAYPLVDFSAFRSRAPGRWAWIGWRGGVWALLGVLNAPVAFGGMTSMVVIDGQVLSISFHFALPSAPGPGDVLFDSDGTELVGSGELV